MKEMKYDEKFVPEEILKTSGIKNAPFNNQGTPIWLDYSLHESDKKTEYVDKGLIRDLFDKFIMTGDNKYCAALQYWLYN